MNDDNATELALRHCGNCHTSRQRIKVKGVYVCPKCDGALEMPNVRKQAGL